MFLFNNFNLSKKLFDLLLNFFTLPIEKPKPNLLLIILL